MNDIEVISAVHRAIKYGDFEPIIDFIKRGDPAIIKNKSARDIITRLMRGEKILGRGQKFKSDRKEKRDSGIVDFVYLLKGFGVPLRSKKKDGAPDAFDYAAKQYHLDSETIRKEIWNKRGRKRATFDLSEGLGAMLKKEGYKIEDLLPTD